MACFFYRHIQRIITPVKIQTSYLNKYLSLICILLISAACSNDTAGTEVSAVEEVAPTPTEAPMAARVNGEGILLTDYEEELQRYQTAASDMGMEVTAETAQAQVLDYLIEQTLFKQAAQENGYALSEQELTQQLDELTLARGGQENLDAYINENFYTPQSFRRTIARERAVIWMRNDLIEKMPATADQVHARQILVDTENEAIAVLRRLEVGTPFSELAYEYDPLTGGDLGWFPRGYLFQPAVEEAAFALQPGQVSGVVETNYGYHILEVIERDPQHTLSGDALIETQRKAIENWLEERRTLSTIEIYVN